MSDRKGISLYTISHQQAKIFIDSIYKVQNVNIVNWIWATGMISEVRML